MDAFPKTRSAAQYAATHGRGELTHKRALVVLQRLLACEAALAGADGHMPALADGPLRRLARAAQDLAGPVWLAANAADPDVTALAAAESAHLTAAPGKLDDIISTVLWARFGPNPAAQHRTALAGPASG